jgi:hypothetical protein
MEIILFILLVGVWAAFVVPSFVDSRRETSVNASTTEPVRPAAPLPTAEANAARQQVLARRKAALIVLAVMVVGTLAGAVLTGSVVLLVATLVADVLLAGYVAMLLTIKQRRGTPSGAATTDHRSDDVRVVGR